jgi:hypothetical protein
LKVCKICVNSLANKHFVLNLCWILSKILAQFKQVHKTVHDKFTRNVGNFLILFVGKSKKVRRNAYQDEGMFQQQKNYLRIIII